MSRDAKADDAGNDTVRDKRIAVLDEAEEFRQIAKSETGKHLDFVKTNINIAEENLLNDGEYDYAVRFALLQIHQAVAGADDGQEATVARIERYRTELTTKAELPPPEKLEQ